MIPAIVVVALGLLALAYVAMPLRAPAAESSAPSRTLEEARSRKRAALGALLELDEDAEMGKISATELESLRARYEAEAIEALVQLDKAESGRDTDDDLESEIEALRERMRCGSCGAVRTPGEPCPRCGA